MNAKDNWHANKLEAIANKKKKKEQEQEEKYLNWVECGVAMRRGKRETIVLKGIGVITIEENLKRRIKKYEKKWGINYG